MNIISGLSLTHFANAIKQYGSDTIFTRQLKDEYGEPAGTETYEIRGLFHHTGETFDEFDADTAGRSIRRKQYFLLSLNGAGEEDDICTINNKRFKVTGVEDIGLEGKLFEYSLENM